MARVYDISQALCPNLPVWPGDTAFHVEPTWEHGDACPVAVAKLTLSPHSGAHADAPLHYDPLGIDIADVDLDPYLGVARLIDLRGLAGPVRAEDLAPWVTGGVRRILIRTYDRFPHDAWSSVFTAVAPEAIEFLGGLGVGLVGIDGPSLDPQDARTLEAHWAADRAGMRILEGLVLDDPPPGDYELIALPLKLVGVDASPVRAVLRSLA